MHRPSAELETCCYKIRVKIEHNKECIINGSKWGPNNKQKMTNHKMKVRYGVILPIQNLKIGIEDE